MFFKKECQQCISYEEEIDKLTVQNNKLKRALRKLKEQYEAVIKESGTTPQTEQEELQGISPSEVDALFAKIKASDYDKDKKRYFRSMLMMIKTSYNPSIHNYLNTELL